MEYIKCTNCKGTGFVPPASGARKWVRCPICGGSGKKGVHRPEIKRRG